MSGSKVSDKEIQDKLQKKLGSGWFSKGYENVSFVVNNGNVLLRGTVETAEDSRKVEDTAKGIDGVTSVTNQITVTGKKSSSGY